MKVEFRESFLKDLRAIKDKKLLTKVREAIESLESANNIFDIQNIKKLRGGKDIIAFVLANSALVSYSKRIHSFSSDSSIGRTFIDFFLNDLSSCHQR